MNSDEPSGMTAAEKKEVLEKLKATNKAKAR